MFTTATLPTFGSKSTQYRVHRVGYGYVVPQKPQKQKASKPLLGVRLIIATNIQNLLDRDFSGKVQGQHGRFRKVYSKISLSKIQRAVQEGALNMTSIEQFAKAFDLEPYQLFIDGLNVRSPQVAADPEAVQAIENIRQTRDRGRETQRERTASRGDDAQARHPPA